MKNTLLLLSFALTSIFAFGQTPQGLLRSVGGINYQTVIRDGDGQPIVNTAITLKMSIRAEAANGTIVYSESHAKVSNSFGLVNLVIGQGTPVEGEFSVINWGAGSHFLEIAIDFTGGGDFQVLGVTQFLSVPYALYSEKTGDTTIWQKNDDAVYYNRGQVGVGTGEPDNSALLEVKSTEKGLLPPRMTHQEINAIVEPANGLTVFCTDCGVDGNGAFFGFINGAWNSILTCIPPATPTAGTFLPLENQITWNWNAVPGANGYKWNSSGTYSTATDMGTSTTKTETGLTCNTLYSRYVWSYNACGISAPIKLEQATDNNSPASPTTGTHVASLNEIVWNWNTVPGATGYKWNFTNQVATAEDLGTLTTKTETGLACNTEFTRFVWSYNDCGNSEVTILTQSTTLNPAVGVSIAASVSPVCAGTPVTFTATPVNGGTQPVYQWTVNGLIISGETNATYTFTPANADAISCQLTSNIPCSPNNPATSNTVTMTVNPILPVSVSIAPNVNPTCAGSSVTFTATPTNGGTMPVYQWKKNGANVGTNSPTYSFVPANGNVVTCVLTSTATCNSGSPATSNAVTMTVNPLLPVSVSISTPSNLVCNGASATFTAVPTNGGATPVYQWKVNGINKGTNSSTYSYVPTNLDLVTCVLNSNANCTSGNPATSNSVAMIVNPSPAAVIAGTHIPSQTQIIWNWNTVSGAIGYKWNTSNNYTTATDLGTATTKTETGLLCNTSYTRYVWAYNSCGNSISTTLIQFTPNCGAPCPGTPTIVYGGKTYNTIQIGTQCWLKENLNIGTTINSTTDQTNNGTIEKYCYNNTETNCDTYGGLYQWYEMMQYSNSEGVKGICPTGWRLPTYAEWMTLSDYLGGFNNVGGKLKESGTTHWNSPNTGATNSSGFTALPGGQRFYDYSGIFFGIGTSGFFWTSTKNASPYVWHWMLSNNSAGFGGEDYETGLGLSVRCLKGEPTSPQISVLPANQNVSSNSGSTSFIVTSNTSWNVSKNASWLSLSNYFGFNNDTITVTFEENLSTDSRVGQILVTQYSGNPTITVIVTQAGATQWNCGQSITDTRDSKIYPTVQIGTQCWMAENLNVGTRIDGVQNQTDNEVVEKYCYDNLETNCDVYGGLYQWNEMMQYTTTAGVKGICPTGWHLPTDSEWTALTTYVSSQTENRCNSNVDYIAKSVAATTNWNTSTFTCTIGNNLAVNNATGFTGLPGGYRDTDGLLIFVGDYGFFGSSTQGSTTLAWTLYLHYYNTDVYHGYDIKDYGFSVRCVRD